MLRVIEDEVAEEDEVESAVGGSSEESVWW